MYTEPLFPAFAEESVEALYSFAYAAYQKGKYEEALPLFRLLTWQKKEHRPYWMGLGATLQMLKQYELAIGAYGYAAILDEKDPYVHWHAAECYHALAMSTKALQALDAALVYAYKKELKEQLSVVRNVWTQGVKNG